MVNRYDVSFFKKRTSFTCLCLLQINFFENQVQNLDNFIKQKLLLKGTNFHIASLEMSEYEKISCLKRILNLPPSAELALVHFFSRNSVNFILFLTTSYFVLLQNRRIFISILRIQFSK